MLPEDPPSTTEEKHGEECVAQPDVVGEQVDVEESNGANGECHDDDHGHGDHEEAEDEPPHHQNDGANDLVTNSVDELVDEFGGFRRPLVNWGNSTICHRLNLAARDPQLATVW